MMLAAHHKEKAHRLIAVQTVGACMVLGCLHAPVSCFACMHAEQHTCHVCKPFTKHLQGIHCIWVCSIRSQAACSPTNLTSTGRTFRIFFATASCCSALTPANNFGHRCLAATNALLVISPSLSSSTPSKSSTTTSVGANLAMCVAFVTANLDMKGQFGLAVYRKGLWAILTPSILHMLVATGGLVG